jgi:hypothetical protein
MRDLRKNRSWNRNEEKLHRHCQLTAADVRRVASLHEDAIHDLASSMLDGNTFQAECIVKRVLRQAVGKRHEASRSDDLPRWLERAVVRACREYRLKREGAQREVVVITRRARGVLDRGSQRTSEESSVEKVGGTRPDDRGVTR